jgi:hypothetical protein
LPPKATPEPRRPLGGELSWLYERIVVGAISTIVLFGILGVAMWYLGFFRE